LSLWSACSAIRRAAVSGSSFACFSPVSENERSRERSDLSDLIAVRALFSVAWIEKVLKHSMALLLKQPEPARLTVERPASALKDLARLIQWRRSPSLPTNDSRGIERTPARRRQRERIERQQKSATRHTSACGDETLHDGERGASAKRTASLRLSSVFGRKSMSVAPALRCDSVSCATRRRQAARSSARLRQSRRPFLSKSAMRHFCTASASTFNARRKATATASAARNLPLQVQPHDIGRPPSPVHDRASVGPVEALDSVWILFANERITWKKIKSVVSRDLLRDCL